MPVSKRLRFEVLRRDNHACRYCGRGAPEAVLTIDHVVPVALGGSDEPSNLVTACRDCNSGKSSVPAGAELIADVAADAIRWANAMRLATEQADEDRTARYELAEEFQDYWTSRANMWVRLPDDWEQAVSRYYRLGLTRDDLLEAAEIAITARQVPASARWRYFCGVCKNMRTDRQEVARAIVTATDTPTNSVAGTSPELQYAAIQYTELSAVCDRPVA